MLVRTESGNLRPIAIVEPHADDAFLSLHTHIIGWVKKGCSITIHTICGESKRMREAEEYARSVGASWTGYRAEDTADLRGFTGNLGPMRGTQVILPLAITHPTHAAVRRRLERKGAWYYVDQPYAITQSNSVILTELLNGMRVVSYAKPSALKYRRAAIFKSQSKFFHFNPPSKLAQTFEMIVRY